LDIKFNLGYPDHDDTMKFTKYVLAILDMLLSLSSDPLWNYSLPIGSESFRIIELVKYLSLTIFDYQRLNQLNEDYADDYYVPNHHRNIRSNYKKNVENINTNGLANITTNWNFIETLPPYAFIEVKYQHISRPIFCSILLLL
jgi:hypothetical protein